jgi:hypothetical protein
MLRREPGDGERHPSDPGKRGIEMIRYRIGRARAGLLIGAAFSLAVPEARASNQGFRIVVPLVQFAGSPPVGDNWVSLPFRCPWQKAKDLCTSRFADSASVSLSKLDPVSGAITTFVCSDSAASPSNFLLADVPRGIRIRNTAATPATLALVGSHEHGKPWPTIYGSYNATLDPARRNYLSVPYTTIWAKAADVCVSLGSPGPSVRILRADPATGTTTTHFCGSTSNSFDLVRGEALLILKTSSGDITGFIPPVR